MPKDCTTINISSFFFTHGFSSRLWSENSFVAVLLQFRKKEAPELFSFHFLNKITFTTHNVMPEFSLRQKNATYSIETNLDRA